MMTMLRTILAWLAAVGILILGFVWLAGWFYDRTGPGLEGRGAAAPPPGPTAEVLSHEGETFLAVPGQLWAADRTQITSEITGKITEITVTAGDRVEVGTVLVKLDPTELSARVAQIREQLPARQARLQEAQAQFERDRALLEDTVVPREQVETSRRLLAEAEAGLAATQQQLIEAQGQLQETTIKATMNGTVVDQLSKKGEVAQPGRPLLEVYRPESLRLECGIPESLVSRLRIGQVLRAGLGPDQRAVQVEIDEIVPQAAPRSRTVLVKARLESAENLLEGQYARLFVPLERRTQLTIPAAALQSVGQLDFVQVIIGDGQIERRFVQPGLPSPSGRIEILSGLDANETILLPAEQDTSTVESDE